VRKRFLFIILASIFLFSCMKKREEPAFPSVIALNYPCYDAARAVLGDRGSVKMLLPPYSESHSYEPTPDDVIRIMGSDLFAYTGGESDYWVTTLIGTLDGRVRLFSLMDNVPTLLVEETSEGMQIEGDGDVDEHVWTSIENYSAIVEGLAEELCEIDSENADEYMANAKSYISKLQGLDAELKDIVRSRKRDILVVADRFPILYFTKSLGLKFHAAFPGCAEETEPSAKTCAFLIDKVREAGIPVVLHMESGSSRLSDVISSETGAKSLKFNSMHTVTKKQFDDGVTYIDLMRENLDVMREALL